MLRLSVAIITLNEEQNLPRTLASVAWADEIVVVDSGSADATCAVAAQHGARVISQPWLGFGAQKNFALEQCTGEWLLSLDADEEVSPELAASFRNAIGTADAHAYLVPRRNFFLGRALLHGGMYPDRKLRLLRRDLFASGEARFSARPVHEDIEYRGATAALTGDLLHHAYATLEQYFEHMNRYSTLGAEQVLQRGQPHGAWWFLRNVVLNPWATFAYNYALRGGFLDGQEGLVYHAYHSCYVSLKYAKAWQAAHAPHDCC